MNFNWRESFNNNRTWKIIGIVVLILIAVNGFGGKNDGRGDDAMRNYLDVSGTGEVVVEPDIAMISFGVTVENLDVAKAQSESAVKMNNILGFLKNQGVEDKDIKTTNYNIYPRYDYIQAKTYPYAGKQILTGYVVSQNVEVKIRALEKSGVLLSGVGEYGVTDISGLTFSIDKVEEVKNQARAEAIKDARAEAEVLAKALGVKLGDIVSFSEDGQYPTPYYGKEMLAMNSGMGGDMIAPQVPAGENKITSTVTITYEIR